MTADPDQPIIMFAPLRNPDPDIPDDDDLTRQQYEVDLDRCLGYFGPRAVIKWAIDYLERQLTATPRDPDTEPF